MIDKELKDLLASLLKSQKETGEQIKETSKQQEETRKRQEATSRQIEETGEQMKRTDKKLESIGAQLGSIGRNQGEMVEEFFYRSLEKNKTLGRLKFDEIDRNIKRTDNSVEFDIILINGDSIGIIEVKNKAHPKNIKPIINKKILHFKIDFPQYENFTYYFGIATMITNKQMIQDAKEEGIFLLTQNAEHLEIVNEGFGAF